MLRIAVIAGFAAAMYGCSNGDDAQSCESGEAAARSEQSSTAVDLLTRCIAQSKSDPVRARAFEIRAWSYSQLGKDAFAASDQESAYALGTSRDYRSLINYTLYLRRAGRFEDSLRAVRSAEEIERRSGQTSMMTQYHLGWALYDLSRYGEALDAFELGIPIQPDYPFVYWQRGLTYEALGQSVNAKNDFERFAKLLAASKDVTGTAKLLPAIREKLRQYGLDKDYHF